MDTLEYRQGHFGVRVLKHSSANGYEAITFLATYERMIHAEVMTHRWSRNYSSSRAIPYHSMCRWIADDPANHLHMGRNVPGMQSGDVVDDESGLREYIVARYHDTRAWTDEMVRRFGPHKTIPNRYLEPWGWITGVMTMGRDQFVNWCAQRCDENADQNIQRLAITMLRLYRQSTPQTLRTGEWHMPFVDDHVPCGAHYDEKVKEAIIWSTARAAWCSYNSPEKNSTFERAKIRHDDCVVKGHFTPTEHQLVANGRTRGLVPGYRSYRSMLPGEHRTRVDLDEILRRYEGVDYLVARRDA
jgi:hypothetical protein